VHSVFPKGDKYRQREARPKSIAAVDSITLQLSAGESVVVNRRPGLTSFLSQLSADYDVVVFTAGRETYASKVLDALDPEVSDATVAVIDLGQQISWQRKEWRKKRLHMQRC
jgi:NLI interacting factor-like phosphatase